MRRRPEYDRRIIGENLRRCRQRKNLSVEQVREYLNIGSLQAIYKWEEGKSYPQADTMFALMELYEIELRDLLDRSRTTDFVDGGEIAHKNIPQISLLCTLDMTGVFLAIEKESAGKQQRLYTELAHYMSNSYHGTVGATT